MKLLGKIALNMIEAKYFKQLWLNQNFKYKQNIFENFQSLKTSRNNIQSYFIQVLMLLFKNSLKNISKGTQNCKYPDIQFPHQLHMTAVNHYIAIIKNIDQCYYLLKLNT